MSTKAATPLLVRSPLVFTTTADNEGEEDKDDHNQEFRCQVCREQLFRSVSNDVAQATNRCNVDFQFLFCAPPLPAVSNGDATEVGHSVLSRT